MGYKNSQKSLFALPSATYALRAGEILAKQGISSKTVTLDHKMSKKGCTYGIELDYRVASRAKDILIDHSIPVKGPEDF